MEQTKPQIEGKYYERVGTALCYLCFAGGAFSIAVDSFTGIALSLFFLFALFTKRTSIPNTPYKYAIVLLLLLAGLSVLLSSDIVQNAQGLSRFWRVLLPFGIFAALSMNSKLLGRSFNVMLAFLSLNALLGILQYYTGLDPMRTVDEMTMAPFTSELKRWHALGTFSHHMTFAGVMLLSLPVFLAGFIASKPSPKIKWLYLAGSVVIGAAILFSLSRSAFLAALFSLFLLLVISVRRKVLLIGVPAILAVIASIIFILPSISNDIVANSPGLKRLSNISIKFGDDRFRMWEAGLNVLKDNWAFGQGVKTIEPLRKQYKAIEERDSAIEGNEVKIYNSPEVGVHNIYLQIALDFGVFALVAYLLMWAGIIFAAIVALRRKSAEMVSEAYILKGIIASWAGFFFMGMFENNFYDGELNHIIMIWIGVTIYLTDKIRRTKKDRL